MTARHRRPPAPRRRLAAWNAAANRIPEVARWGLGAAAVVLCVAGTVGAARSVAPQVAAHQALSFPEQVAEPTARGGRLVIPSIGVIAESTQPVAVSAPETFVGVQGHATAPVSTPSGHTAGSQATTVPPAPTTVQASETVIPSETTTAPATTTTAPWTPPVCPTPDVDPLCESPEDHEVPTPTTTEPTATETTEPPLTTDVTTTEEAP